MKRPTSILTIRDPLESAFADFHRFDSENRSGRLCRFQRFRLMARGCFGLSRFHCRDNERFDDFAERGATSIADILFQLPKLLFQSMAPEFEQELMV